MTRPYTISLYIICSLFLLLYFILCWHSRLATDDYPAIWQVYNHGIIKETYRHYMLWCGRALATLLGNIIYQYLDNDQTWYFLYPLLSGFILLAGAYKAISAVSSNFNFNLDSSHKKTASFLFTALLFFITFDTGETWFWYNSISHYLASVIAFIWGTAFLFDKRNGILYTLSAVICFIYVGSASEVYSVVYGQFFLYFFYIHFKKHNYNTASFFRDSFCKRLFWVALFFLLSFIITVIAPGNYLRAGFFPKPQITTTITLSSYMFGKLLAWFLPKKALFVIAFAFPFFIIGKQYNTGEKITRKLFLKNTIQPTLALLTGCITVFVLIGFIMSQSGEYRIWFVISFLLSVYFCGLCFYAGYKGLVNNEISELIKKISVATGLIVMPYMIIDQYTVTKKYSEAHDQRIAFLLKTNEEVQKDTLITLPLLPPGGMLYSGEITADPDNFLNEELKQGYRLKFHVVSEKKVP